VYTEANKSSKHFLGRSTIVVGLLALLSGPTLADGSGGFPLTPFSRVAIIDPDGADPIQLAKDVATEIATYVATVDDADPPDVTSNWVLAGVEGTTASPEQIEEAILRVPTPIPGKKVNILEMCNKTFASKALGVLPVVDGDDSTKIVNGYIHATALPCEVAVYAGDDGLVHIEMLNPEAIFSLFFTDVLFGTQMEDPTFAEAIQELPAQVNSEIRIVIGRALGDAGISYTPSSESLGPVYSSVQDVGQAVADSPYQSPYVHFVYEKADGSDFSNADVKAIADAIIRTVSVDGAHERSLDAQLYTRDWRAARSAPLAVPGNNLVIETCSPTNATMAMDLGLEYATALPCELAVKSLDWDGVAGNEILMITYLDPHFMFNALFNDAFDALTDAELADFSMLPTMVYEDLRTIVKASLQRKDLGFTLRRRGQPEQVFFDMLGVFTP
jgi:uncharacterized protein (DUF302 family)